MSQLFPGLQLLCLVTLGNGGAEIAFAIMCHAQRQLCVKVLRRFSKNRLQFLNRAVELACAEVKHRVVVSFFECHSVSGN